MREISVHRDDKRSGRRREAGQEGTPIPALLLPKQAAAVALDDLRGAIVGSTVDDDDLRSDSQRPDGLSNLGQQLFEVGAFIESGNNDREVRSRGVVGLGSVQQGSPPNKQGEDRRPSRGRATRLV
jgi:hypothetical protein